MQVNITTERDETLHGEILDKTCDTKIDLTEN